jgi:hypothetical protein
MDDEAVQLQGNTGQQVLRGSGCPDAGGPLAGAMTARFAGSMK